MKGIAKTFVIGLAAAFVFVKIIAPKMGLK